MSFQVFISYKSEYRDFARRLKDQVRAWGYRTWFDAEDIPKGAYFRHAIQQGLDQSDVLLGVMTQEAFASREVMAEWDYFLSQNKDLLPLKYRECKPLYHLVAIQWIDFTADEAAGFAALRERLNELAASLAGAALGEGERIAEAGDEPAPEPDRFADHEEAKAARDDVLAPLPEPAATPPPAPAPAAASPRAETAPPPASPPPEPQAAPRKRETETAQMPPGAPPAQPAAPRQPLTLPPLARRFPLRSLAAALTSMVVLTLAALLVVNNNLISMAEPPLALETAAAYRFLLPLAVLAVGAFVAWNIWRTRQRRRAEASPEQEAASRARMLDQVSDFWITGVLQPALESGAFDLGLSAAPGAVLRHSDYGDYPLPGSARIGDIFDDMQRELLILGAPGAGKTVLLLQLAQTLIARARADSSKPIPVVVNLASWAAESKPLADWLADELHQKYRIPRPVAQMWIGSQQITPLLDGLDEVAEASRSACLEAINAFRASHTRTDLAVCSRVKDYALLTSKLDLRGAVVLEPLSEAQIAAYLDRDDLAGLRAVLADDPTLREMTGIPFLLNALVYAYRGLPPEQIALAAGSSAEARRRHLFDRWVERRLTTPAARAEPAYTPQQMRRYLGWLARKLSALQQTVFYLEGLQPDWLDTRGGRWLYDLCAGLLYGAVFGGFLTLVLILFPNTAFPPPWGLVGGLLLGVLLLLSPRDRERIGHVQVIEKLVWNWRNAALGLIFVSVTAVALLLTAGRNGLAALPLLLPLLLLGGLETRENSSGRSAPNDGIQQTLRNFARLMLGSGAAFALTFLLYFSQDNEAGWSLLISLAFGLAAGVWIALSLGGSSVVKHALLRCLIWLSGGLPWNAGRFLNTAARHALLRRVGGGFIFAHRYLLDYFAGEN